MAKKRRNQTGPPGTPLEVAEAQRSFKGGYRHYGWGDPTGSATYRSHGDYYKTDVGGYGRSVRHRRVASSDFGKLERGAERQGKRLRAAMSRRYGGMSIPGKSYPLGIQKGHGMRGR